MQKLVNNYHPASEKRQIVMSTEESRILYFAETNIIIFLVCLRDFGNGKIDLQMIRGFEDLSKQYKPKEKFLVSYQELDDSASNMVKSFKIKVRKPDQILKEINEVNLDMALDSLQAEVSFRDDEKFQRGKFNLFLDSVKNASSNITKKNTLESLAVYLFNSLEGFKVIKENYRGPSEEIDLIVANESKDSLLEKLGTPFAVECRHRKTPAASKDIRDFKGKLEASSIKFGILITLKDITGKVFDAVAEIREAKKKGISIIVISMSDLILIGNGKNPLDVIKECYYKYI